MKVIYDFFGGRRFFFALLVFSVSVGLVVAGKLDSGSYVTITLGTLGVYVGGNVVQKVFEKNIKE